ncbi:flagellar basal body rod C-terminal domain-containing protein [Desulforhopalus sp. IMCC35007]|uniref:flagellar basal body rod C-terminal domain-containing protein n=1 Tax=Desulforhopalus sp. IMCC35007 TaxID=2569543 RepID=UPI0010AE0901|nr:flagellar basal body rod C-terminal domain-containing protein [Desulforhopalus sp. IMCC35007]TKB05729.1 flagellar biosynthesis protein FlgC [Desulforhopalus sp. IMCC35007]
MISAYNTALSALQSFGTKLQSNSNNIANANTDGFKRTRVTNASTEPSGVKAQIDKINSPGPVTYEATNSGYDVVELSNVDLSVEIPDMNLNATMYKANLKTIETVSEMAGELLNMKA